MLTSKFSLSEIRKAVRDQVALILEEKELPARDIKSEDLLNVDLGLTSLDLAILVTTLEIQLRADPFQELVAITSVRTIGDLEDAYLQFFSKTGDGVQDDELAKVRRQAENRRGGK